MAEHLPDDLIIEILCRLPIKILVGFKCVSKTWYILISDFCIPIISREPSPVSGFVCHAGRLSTPKERFVDFVPYSDECAKGNATDASAAVGLANSLSNLLPPEYFPYDLLDCCNGLILLGSRIVPRYYLYNPATKEFFALPIFPKHSDVCHAALAFNPRESSSYKVVRFIYALNFSASNPPLIDIFSSESSDWVRSNIRVEPPVAYGVGWAKYTVYLGGFLYKISFSMHLLCFDLQAVSAQAIDLPYKDKIDKDGFIGISKDVLNYANHDESRILIWHFDNHCKAGCYWVLKYSILIEGLRKKHNAAWQLFDDPLPIPSAMFMPYAIHPSADIIFIGVPDIVFSYNLQTQKLKVLCRKPPEGVVVWGHSSFYPYAHCFVKLKARCPKSSLLLTELDNIKLGTRHNDGDDNEVKKGVEPA